MSNYATKDDLNGRTGVYTTNVAVKSDLASLKTEENKIDADKLKTFLADLSKLSNVVDILVKQTVYDQLVTKFDAIDNSKLVRQRDYDTKLKKLSMKLFIMINILLLHNLIN